MLKDHATIPTEWFDERRVEVIEEDAIVPEGNKADPGGPRPVPPPLSTP